MNDIYASIMILLRIVHVIRGSIREILEIPCGYLGVVAVFEDRCCGLAYSPGPPPSPARPHAIGLPRKPLSPFT